MPIDVRATRKLSGIKGVSGLAEISSARDVPRRLYDLETKPSRAAPRRIAESFLKQVASRLGLSPDLSQVRFDKVKKTLFGCHVLFQQRHAGKPISGAWLRIDIDPDGRVFNVAERPHSRAPAQARRPRSACAQVAGARPLTQAQALAKAFDVAPIASGGRRAVLHAELMYGTVQSKPRLAWKIVVRTTKPLAEWKLYLDAIPARSSLAATCSSTRLRAGVSSIPIRSPCSTTRR
jgi:hypothetical protein